MKNLTLLLALLGLLTGCDLLCPVKAYQQRATEACEKHHTPEQCKPLPYPSCQPGDAVGAKCQ